MNDDTVKYAGVSTFDGGTKIRFGNSIERIKVLIKRNHSNIIMEELPRVMTKLEACKWLIDNNVTDDPIACMTIEEAYEKYLAWDIRDKKRAEAKAAGKRRGRGKNAAKKSQSPEEKLAELRSRAGA